MSENALFFEKRTVQNIVIWNVRACRTEEIQSRDFNQVITQNFVKKEVKAFLMLLPAYHRNYANM